MMRARAHRLRAEGGQAPPETDPERSIHRALGTYVEAEGDDPFTYRWPIDLSESEFAAMDDAVQAIEACGPSFPFDLLIRNHADLVSTAEFVTTTLGLGRRFATPDRTAFGRAVMGAMVNWLTSMRLYLDHTETTVKRRFGKDSEEAERFKAATASAYDGRVGYRFCSRLRNYVQHCGEPLSRIELGAVVDDRRGARLWLDRDELLESYDGWGPVRMDLEAMEPSFDPVPLVQDAMDGLKEVRGVVIRLLLDDAVARVAVLVSALERIDAAGIAGIPTLALLEPSASGDDLELATRSFDRASVQRLAEVASGSRTSESLIVPSADRASLLSPPRVRERLHADARGVQIMSAFYAFNGPDRHAQLDRTIGELVEADGDIGPVIGGLINLNATLAAIAAIGLGRTPQGLIAGLAEDYRSPDE
jgi:hypothetical protein